MTSSLGIIQSLLHKYTPEVKKKKRQSDENINTSPSTRCCIIVRVRNVLKMILVDEQSRTQSSDSLASGWSLGETLGKSKKNNFFHWLPRIGLDRFLPQNSWVRQKEICVTGDLHSLHKTLYWLEHVRNTLLKNNQPFVHLLLRFAVFFDVLSVAHPVWENFFYKQQTNRGKKTNK